MLLLTLCCGRGRSVMLSEGRVEADGTLQCAYHGWRFNGEGQCTTIPQTAEEDELKRAVASKKSCAVTYPVQVLRFLPLHVTHSPSSSRPLLLFIAWVWCLLCFTLHAVMYAAAPVSTCSRRSEIYFCQLHSIASKQVCCTSVCAAVSAGDALCRCCTDWFGCGQMLPLTTIWRPCPRRQLWLKSCWMRTLAFTCTHGQLPYHDLCLRCTAAHCCSSTL